jgi:hypothetical protein
MGLVIEGEYYSKSRDAGPYVPPSIPSDRYKDNYALIQWDKPTTGEDEDERGQGDTSGG